MTKANIEMIADAGMAKREFSRQHPMRYLTRAAVAGAFIMTGSLLSLLCGAWFYADALPVAKLLGAMTFSAALVLITLIGGELFTGSDFVMAIALYEDRVSAADVFKVWIYCYLGNLIGILILSFLIVGSGANGSLLSAYLAVIIPGKLSCSWYMLLLRGILCNFLVCIGVLAGFKQKSEMAKIIVMFVVITTFVMAGFEHSVANMALFSLYALFEKSPDWAGMGWNMLWVTLGNVIGGGVLLGLPIWLAAEPGES